MIHVKRSDFDEFDVKVHSYSGRAMWGKTCLAITVASISELVGFVQDLTQAVEFDREHPLAEFCSIIPAVRGDQLGLALVFYWPSVQLIEDTPTPEEL